MRRHRTKRARAGIGITIAAAVACLAVAAQPAAAQETHPVISMEFGSDGTSGSISGEARSSTSSRPTASMSPPAGAAGSSTASPIRRPTSSPRSAHRFRSAAPAAANASATWRSTTAPGRPPATSTCLRGSRGISRGIPRPGQTSGSPTTARGKSADRGRPGRDDLGRSYQSGGRRPVHPGASDPVGVVPDARDRLPLPGSGRPDQR